MASATIYSLLATTAQLSASHSQTHHFLSPLRSTRGAVLDVGGGHKFRGVTSKGITFSVFKLQAFFPAIRSR
ncbi:hypothetical protein GBA52_022723 [Prunus armeniaca]|nr:hypothetical protein GBA52_022723 [Prunus armeniaca]